MNVAVIGNDAFTLIKFRLSLMKQLSETHTVFAVAPGFSAEEKALLQGQGIKPVAVKMHRFGTNPVKEVSSIISLIRFFLDYKIDLSLSYFLKPVLYSTLAGKAAGVKRRIALIEGLGYFFTGTSEGLKCSILKIVISTFFKVSLPLADKVVFLNQDDRNEVVAMVPNLDTHILGGIGVDLDEYGFVPPSESKETHFVIVARVLREKGILEFIEAARLTSERYPLSKFWIVGGLDQNPGGIQESELRNLIMGTNITWVGQVQNVKDWLIKSHVFVLPSYREGVPRSTQEAMAVGRAVITTNVQGCRDTVVPGKNGFMIKAKSVKELAEAFEEYLKNKQLITSHGVASRAIAVENYNSSEKNEILSRLLEGKTL